MRSQVEQYRHLCMLVLRARGIYYCTGSQVMSDFEYDQLEDGLKQYERASPLLRHPLSPTGLVGSSNAVDYPRSIQMEIDRHLGQEQPFYAYKRPTLQAGVLPSLVKAHKDVTGVDMAPQNLQMLIDEGMINAEGQPLDPEGNVVQ